VLIVSLTGGIATGKSVVSKILQELGCYIHSADRVAHKLMEPDQPAWKKIVAHFGTEILNADKTISRAMLGAIAFRDEKERLYLNRLIHPLVLEKKKEVIAQLQKEGHYKIFISEAALTLEAGFAHFFDKIIVVYCRPGIQVQRLMERDRISREEALRKIKAQMPMKKKLKFADYIIDTSGSLPETVEQTERVFRQLMQDPDLKSRAEKL
jgi:dephospho-CoA kinase